MKNLLFLAYLIMFISAKKLRKQDQVQCGIVIHDNDNSPDNLHLSGDCEFYDRRNPCEWKTIVDLEYDLSHDVKMVTTEACMCEFVITGRYGLRFRKDVEPYGELVLSEIPFCKCDDSGCAHDGCDWMMGDSVETIKAYCSHRN